MGVKGLYSYLRPYRRAVSLEGKGLVGVDAMSILYKFRGNTEMILKFLETFVGFTFIFVFDGKAPVTKQEELALRRDQRNEAKDQLTALKTYLDSPTSQEFLDSRGRASLERKIQQLELGKAWSMTREVRHAFQDLLREKGIPSVKALGEADDLLMSLWSDHKLVAVLSTDMDFLVAGVERLWIPSASGAEEICLSRVLAEEDVDQSAFLDAALLCGVDGNSLIPNMYPQKAFSLMRHYGSIESMVRKQTNLESILDKLTDLRGRFLIFPSPEYMVQEKHKEIILQL